MIMQGNYNGYLLGADAFFANSEVDALAEFSKRAGCEVRKCVYPVRGERVYCISTSGQLFGLIRDESKHVFIGYSIKVCIMHKTAKRPNPGVWYNVQNYLTGNGTVVRAEKLVYNTFVLGRWDENVKVQFKDGDQHHVSLDNLEEPHETFDPQWAVNMSHYTQVYRREFNRIVGYVAWFCNIREDEAQDCVQDTFMWLTSAERNMPSYFFGAWVFWSKTNGMRYIRENKRVRSIEDWDVGKNDRPLEIDILGMIRGEKHRDMLLMKLHGYTEREIAEKYGTTAKAVQRTVQRVIANLRKIFLKDFKVLGIEPPKGNHGNLFT